MIIMPRQARIDAPGALHHLIKRGIEKQSIFRDDRDKDSFIEFIGNEVQKTITQWYARVRCQITYTCF